MLRSRIWLWGLRILAALIVATALTSPFYLGRRNGWPNANNVLTVPSTHDMAQHLGVMDQFDKVLRAGAWYPRWLPDANNGYGLAWTNFYPPGLYFVTSLINAAVNDWMYTMFIVSILGLAASGLSFYLVSRLSYGAIASGVAALLYMAAPYHTLDLYWRGAMPEFMGFVLVPLIVYFAFKLGTSGKARYVAGLGFFHGIYLLTHFPVAYLMTCALGFYAVSRAARERDWKIAIRIGLGIGVALLLGSIYWVPAALETSKVAEHFSQMFPYHRSYLTLIPGGDDFAEVVNISFAVQTLTLIAGIWLLYSRREPAGVASNLSVDEDRSPEQARWMQTRQWVLMALATTFMCTTLSYYVSRLIPKIDAVSFAWRWLVIATFFSSLVVAAAIDRLSIRGTLGPVRLWAYRIVVTAAIGFSVWCTVERVVLPTRFHPSLIRPQNFLENGFIPANATAPQYLPASALATIEPPVGEAEVVRWDPLYREVRVDTRQPSILKLKTYNFPGWVARVDGQATQVSSDANGAQVVPLAAGEHTVKVFFVNTPPRTLGGAITGVAFLTICGLIGADLIGRRRASVKEAVREAADQESNRFEAVQVAPGDDETSRSIER